MHDLKAYFCLSSTESLTMSMNNKGNSILPDMNGIDAKHLNTSITHDRIVDPAVQFYPLDGLADVKNSVTEQIALSTSLLSIVTDSYVNYAPQKSQSVIESERKQELRAFNSFSRVEGNDFDTRGTVDDLSIPVQYDFLPTDDSFFPVGIEDQLLPKSKLRSLSLHEGLGFVHTPQVVEGSVRCKTIGLHEDSHCLLIGGTSCDKFQQCGCAYAWPPRIVDEKFRKDSNTVEEYAICCGLGCSREMYELEQLNEADDILAGKKVIANQSSQEFKHYSENLEPRKCRSYFADSVIDCRTLVENIQNSSLLLIASHSSDRLVDAGVQALLSVIENLVNYLMDRAGVSASCIQATMQPVKDHSGSNSRICEKVTKWNEEENAEDYGILASKLSDKSYTSRGNRFVEGGRCSTQILAKSQRTCSKEIGKLSGHEKDKYLERRLSELQKRVKKLREDFGFELKERDTAINFYKYLLREYEAVLSTMTSEMVYITELQFLEQNKFRTDAHLFDVRGGKTSLEISLKPRENVIDQAERSKENDPEDPDMNTNLISAMDNISPVNVEGAFRKPVDVLHSRSESLGKTSEIRGITGSDWSVVVDSNPNDTPQAHYEDSFWQQAAISMFWERSPQEPDTRRTLKFCTHDAVGVSPEIETREEILRRFKLLEECNHLHMREKNREKQHGKAIIDEPSLCKNSLFHESSIDEPGLCKNSLFHENSVHNTYPKSPESNQEGNQSRQDEGTYLNPETYFLSLDRSLRKGETSEIKNETKYKFSPEVDWKLEGNVDQTAMLSSCGKLCESHETQTNMNHPRNVTSQTDYTHSVWDQAAILFSRKERLGDPYISRNMNAVDNDTLDVIAKSHSMHNEEILSRFRSLPECNISGLMARAASAAQSDEATMNVSGSYDYSFHLQENKIDSSCSESYESDSSCSESYESLQGGDNFWEWANFFPSQEERLREGEFSDIVYQTNSTCSNKVDLNLEKVRDRASILLSREKVCENPKTNTYLNCLVNITPEAHYEGSIWDRAAILFSREQSCRESERCRDEITCDNDAMEREECSDQSDTTQRDYGEQLSKAIIDEPSLCKNSLFHENSVDNSYPKSFKSIQEDNQSRQDEGTYLNPESHFLSLERSLRKSETSEIRDETNSKVFLEVDWKLKGNVDQTALLLSCGKLCETHETQTNLNHPMNVTPQTDYKQSIWDREVILFSREERLADPSISRNMNAVDNDTLDVIAKGHSMHNEEILSRFRSLPGYNKSGLMARASSAVQSDEAIVNMPGSCNYSFHLEENEIDSSYSESYESLQGDDNFSEWATFFPSQQEKLREGEFSDIRDQTNSTCSNKVDLNLEQVRDRASILLSREKVCENPKTNTYLTCLVNIIPEVHYEGSIWDRAAILFSGEENCGESERCRDEITCNHDAMEREEILHRFKVLQECSDQSDRNQRDYREQFSEAIIDEPGLCNYFLHLKEIACDNSNSESHKSVQEHNQAFHGEEPANKSVYPDTNEVAACSAVLYNSEASGDGKEDDQPIVASRSFEKQTSSLHESEPEGNCDIPASPYFIRQSPQSHLELNIPVSVKMEQLVLPSTESFFEENKLIRIMSEHYQLEPSSLIQTSDVAVGSQSQYFYNEMKLSSSKSNSNQGELINTNAMEYSARERNCGNVFTRDHSSQTLSPTSSILKLVSGTSNTVTGNKNQNCRNPSKRSTDAESLNQEELNCSPQYQYDIDQHTFYSELESSSTESESSWEYVEIEADIEFQ